MNNTDNTDPGTTNIPDHGNTKTLSFALFHCNPLVQPPFNLDLGFSDASMQLIHDCQHIPDAIEKMEEFCKKENFSKSSRFTLLYPIYLEAMGTDEEDTMHNIAWIIKEQADLNNWGFGRIGGYTNKTIVDFM